MIKIIPALPGCVLSFAQRCLCALWLVTWFSISSWATEPELNSPKQVLQIAIIDWCPHICPHAKKKGYVLEIIEQVFQKSDFTLHYKVFPWSRSIAHTNNGVTQALLAAAKPEAPNLLYPRQPVGYQRACFYTPAASHWKYTGPLSLKGLRIGIAVNVALEEITTYAKEHPEQFSYLSDSERYMELRFRMLKGDRIDTFISTEGLFISKAHQYQNIVYVKNAGCLTKSAIYMAFTAQKTQQDTIRQAMKLYDEKIDTMKRNGAISKIMARYELRD